MKLIAICFLSFSLFAQGQEIKNSSYSLAVRMNRNDFFVQMSRIEKHHLWQHELGFGYGINRTFFQSRFYPEIFYRAAYKILGNDKWALGPQASIYSSTFEINRNSHSRLYVQEALIGLWLEFGGKIKMRVQIDSGIQMESFRSMKTQKVLNSTTLGYNGQIGFIYAF